MARKALVTLLIGEDYRRVWEQTARPGWKLYAERHGYDIIVIGDYIDASERGRSRSPHWQKCLIFRDSRLNAYEDVVWLDADVAINPENPPCIVSEKTTDKIGVVIAPGQPHTIGRVRYGQFMERRTGHRWPFFPGFYQLCGLTDPIEAVINTGVMAFSRSSRPWEVLEHVYASFEQTPHSMFENVPLSYHLLQNDLAEPLNPLFNVIWPHQVAEHYLFLLTSRLGEDPAVASACVNMALRNAYFLHFVGFDHLRSQMHLLEYGGDWEDVHRRALERLAST